MVNAFMKKIQKGSFANSVDPDETPQYAASHQICAICHVKHILGNDGQVNWC